MQRRSDEKGFTLIEVIVTLILVGITAALAGMWIVSVANGYLFVKMNMDTLQKSKLAVARLTKEFTGIDSVNIIGTNGGQITFNRWDESVAVLVPVTVSLSGNTLQLNVNNTGNNTLTDSVNTFSLTYCDSPTSTNCPSTWSTTSRLIEITLKLTGANNILSTFTWSVTPRNL
jgi:prepilin-type N-terminal cleavage/methylation domain-containing protein